jgi:2-polyprenyl-6-methoxyphenol hydroxylase-like FAD-dependent oxidoreductase
LRKAGIEATVYEAHDRAAVDAGAMLSVAPNGLAALDVVGLADEVRVAGHDLHAMVMEKGSGKRLMTVASLPGLPPSCTVLRRELVRVIRESLAAAGIAVEYGKRLAGVEEGPESVTAKFEDGSSAAADVLIGADGIHSVVRTSVRCTGSGSTGTRGPQRTSPGLPVRESVASAQVAGAILRGNRGD